MEKNINETKLFIAGGEMRRRRRNAMVVRMNEENQKRNPFPLSNFGSGCANNNDNGEDDDDEDNNVGK